MINQDKFDLVEAAELGLAGFSARLMEVIASTKLSQSEFARRIGASSGFISDAARGLKKPGTDFLFQIKMTYDISIDWLLNGDGTMRGGKAINIELLQDIQLYVAIAKAAVIETNPIATALLSLVQDGRLDEADNNEALHAYLSSLVETNDDSRLAIELYNSHLSTDNPNTQCRNILMATIAHFELKKPVNKLASLMRASQPPKAVPVQVNIAATQRIAGRDYHEK